MRNKKEILMICSVLLCSLIVVKSADARNISSVYLETVSQEKSAYSQDVIVKKYRIYNGKRQYRRWNETKQCWVDPKWIDVE